MLLFYFICILIKINIFSSFHLNNKYIYIYIYILKIIITKMKSNKSKNIYDSAICELDIRENMVYNILFILDNIFLIIINYYVLINIGFLYIMYQLFNFLRKFIIY